MIEEFSRLDGFKTAGYGMAVGVTKGEDRCQVSAERDLEDSSQVLAAVINFVSLFMGELEFYVAAQIRPPPCAC